MPKYIIKITDPKDNTDYFMEWSTVVDAPITYGCSLEEFKEYYKKEYGNQGMKDFEELINIVLEHGISIYPFSSLESLIDFNHAGKNGGKITIDDILNRYCRNKLA